VGGGWKSDGGENRSEPQAICMFETAIPSIAPPNHHCTTAPPKKPRQPQPTMARTPHSLAINHYWGQTRKGPTVCGIMQKSGTALK